MPLPDISEQQMLFVQEYAKDRNGVRAALAAGFVTSYQAACEQARQLLRKPEIKQWVKSLLRRQAKALKFKPSKTLRNWMLASTADLTYFEVDKDGRLTTAPGVPREYLRAVRKLKQTRTEKLGKDNNLTVEVRTELELRDPFGPECKLMEHFGELKGEEAANGPGPLDILGRLAALAVAQQSARERGGQPADGGAGGAAVAPEAAAGGGVPE